MTKLQRSLKILKRRMNRRERGLVNKGSVLNIPTYQPLGALEIYLRDRKLTAERQKRNAAAQRGALTRKGLTERPPNWADKNLPAVISFSPIPVKPTRAIPNFQIPYVRNPHNGTFNTIFVKLTAHHRSVILERFGYDGKFITGYLLGTEEKITTTITGKRMVLMGVSCTGRKVPIDSACRCTPQMAAAVEKSIAWQKGL